MYDDDLSTLDDLAGAANPRYCPHCDRDGAPDETLCAHCGTPLRDQGYCTVCEHFLRLDAGDDCPKHEVPLADQAPATLVVPKDAAIRWTTIATYADSLEANAPLLRLEAEGIPTFLEGERMGRNTLYNVATGGVKLQVPAGSVADARVILSQTWTSPATADDLDDAWDDLAPAPRDARKNVMKGVIVLLLIGPFILTCFGMFLAKLSG